MSLTSFYTTHFGQTVPCIPDSIQKSANHSGCDTTKLIPLFIFADEYPEYPGGEQAMIRFIRENIQYPELAYSHGHEGTVLLEFIVDRKGAVDQIKVLKSIGLGCDKAAVAVFKKMPRWQPAVQGGRAIAVRYITPVKFSLF
jgi:protein TonB